MAYQEKNIASLSRGSEEVYSLICLPCHRDGTTIPAHGYCNDCHEHLCHTCYKHHTKPTPCKHHKLLDRDTMPSAQQLNDTPVHASTIDNLTTPCPRHKTEMIKFYCHDHELLLCSICTTLEHTKPCHVDYIPEISDKIINSRDYKGTIERIDILLKKCTSIETETSRDANKSNESLKDALQDVKQYRQEINKRMDKLQKEIETKIQCLQHQNDETKKSTRKVCEDVMKKLNMAYDSMKQLNTSKQADKLFIEVKQAQNQLQDYERSVCRLSAEGSIDEYKFVPSLAINDVLHKDNLIGDISTKHQADGDPSSQSGILSTLAYENITPKDQHEICIKVGRDRNRCFVTGMTFLPHNRLILNDNSNNTLKLVDVNKQSVISRLWFGREHFIDDITPTTSTQVAVTVPDRQLIQFITVSESNNLNKTHSITTNGKCNGICSYQGKLVVTYHRAGKLEILDMNGRVIKKVKTDATSDNFLNKPLYVEANSSTIYVSTGQLKEVVMLNWRGEITGRIRNINSPMGLALLSNGSLIACDNTGNKVDQVSEDSTKSNIVLQDITYPWTVCVDEIGQKLYISRATKYNHMNNNILVYNI